MRTLSFLLACCEVSHPSLLLRHAVLHRSFLWLVEERPPSRGMPFGSSIVLFQTLFDFNQIQPWLGLHHAR